MADYLKIHDNDNVVVTLKDLKKGDVVAGVTLLEDVKTAHKVSLIDLKQGQNVIKYGFPIGHAKEDIKKGSWVHVHNLKSNLGEELEYSFDPHYVKQKEVLKIPEVNLYKRKFDRYGIRNKLLIVPLVGCINASANSIKKRLEQENDLSFMDGVVVTEHPYGCSQMGDDHEYTKFFLQKIVKHPNAGGVLVLALGCENNQIEAFKESLSDYDQDRVYFLKSQDVEDEVEEGYRLCVELLNKMKSDKRVKTDLSKINVGLKCGGSDGFSGITANPLVGIFSDYLIACHGSSILSEVPEMFGAEQVLMERAKDKSVFELIVKLINDFKKYYQNHNQVCYENPSPGNKAGGITTLEEKSLGCVQKAGTSEVKDVLFDQDLIKEHGLSLLKGPGNDMVACSNLASCGCQLILFTTGRGTPFGTIVPTIKVGTNTHISEHKKNWIDFNAGSIIDGKHIEEVFNDFVNFIVGVINGEIKTRNELNHFEEIAIFKDGVTL